MPSKKKSKAKKRRPTGEWYVDTRPGEDSDVLYVFGWHPVTGKRIRKTTRTTCPDHANRLMVKWRKEAQDEEVHGRKAVTTFGGALAYYLDNKDPGSLERYLDDLYDEFGDTKINDLTSIMIKEYANDKHPNCSGVTKNKYVFEPMITVIRYAAKDQLCALPLFNKFEGQSERIDAAPEEDIWAFLTKTRRVKLRALVLLITTTGARCIDARRLRWDQVYPESLEVEFLKTKNGEDRSVPVRPDLMAMLMQLKEEEGLAGPFPYNRTDTVNKEIWRECERLGLNYYPSHRLGRHAFAERLLSNGVDLKEAKDAGGWKSMEVFEERYGHLKQERIHDTIKENADAVWGGLRVVNGGKS